MKKGIIIGAGIGGLTTSIALSKYGISSQIFEQSGVLGEVGAGIWVAPNGLKIYHKLGITEEIIKAGNPLDKISVVDLNFKPISTIDGEKVCQKHGFKTVAIHRADLHKILVSQIDSNSIHLNKKLKSIHQDGEVVVAQFDDGSISKADFIICADGIKSVGRRILYPQMNFRYSGQTCWRFITEYDFEKGERGKMYEVWSNQKGLRVGYSKINTKQVYVFITNYVASGISDRKESIKNDLLNLCKGFPKVIHELIESCDSKSIIRNDLFDFAPIRKWVQGNIALLGDAAHATTPNLGQGACQAIEDAWVISKMISDNENIAEAFLNYEKTRLQKATFITNTSYQFAKITNLSGLSKSLVKTIIRLTPEAINEKQLDKIYNISD
jgi:2-polyprenyl-6-methoxyphenol hydroxylase-like FAD-dependent oxidoreductase